MIASDLHGDAACTKSTLDAFDKEGADKLLLLGDILYHGPRNDLPDGYAPKEVISLLNERRESLLCVRGNCDTEVDQMVLNFPILADYAILSLDGITVFATHGHKYNLESLPPLAKGEVLLHGHTHVYACDCFGEDNLYLNPGSASLPKNGNPKTYMIYENKTFTLKTFDGKTVFSKQIYTI